MELASFVEELNSYIQNVNEIDEVTVKLLTETIISVNKLQINSKLCEATSSNVSDFVKNLNHDIFQCRRYIICRLCHVSNQRTMFCNQKKGFNRFIVKMTFISGTNSTES